jgi:hypothetical protein
MTRPQEPSAAPPPPRIEVSAHPAQSRAAEWFGRVAASNPRILYLAWAVVVIAWIGSFSLLWVCWLLGRDMWVWTHGELLRMVPAILGTIILFFVPVWGWMGAAALSRIVADSTFTSEASTIAAVHERVRETEEDALNRLETTDQAGLLPLLRYSRAQLDSYYAMGLAQTRRSFVNAVIAMWLGFAILLAGIVLYIGPVEQIGIHRPSADFKLLILSSAAIVELISALFLWVYRSTIGQLTFYYRLQMHSHTAILCFRISDTMGQSDEAKRAIVDRLLGASVLPERPAASGSRGLLAMLSRA